VIRAVSLEKGVLLPRTDARRFVARRLDISLIYCSICTALDGTGGKIAIAASLWLLDEHGIPFACMGRASLSPFSPLLLPSRRLMEIPRHESFWTRRRAFGLCV